MEGDSGPLPQAAGGEPSGSSRAGLWPWCFPSSISGCGSQQWRISGTAVHRLKGRKEHPSSAAVGSQSRLPALVNPWGLNSFFLTLLSHQHGLSIICTGPTVGHPMWVGTCQLSYQAPGTLQGSLFLCSRPTVSMSRRSLLPHRNSILAGICMPT